MDNLKASKTLLNRLKNENEGKVAQATNSENDLNSLQDENKKLVIKCEELQKQISDILVENEELKAKLDETQSKNEELKAKLDETQSKNEELVAKLDELNKEPKKAKSSDAKK